MQQRKLNPLTIVLWALLAALVILIVMLFPGTLNAYRQLQTEQSATPTPTANIASMMLVTFDPNNTPTPTPFILKNGSSGEEVNRLQQRLKELGYYSGDVDGQYGPGTAEAVRLFQAQLQLGTDGLAGSDTRAALYADSVPTYIPTPSPSPTPSQLMKGDKGDSVRQVQERLKELGFYNISVDGDFGSGTEDALRLFQQQHGLNVNGIANTQTLSLLMSAQAQPVVTTPTPDPAVIPMLVNKKHPVSAGFTPDDLVNLQSVLPADLVTIKGSSIQGDRTAVQAMETMLLAAREDGITGFQVEAGWRSVEYQQDLFDQEVQRRIADGRSEANAISNTKLTVADPGTSEHHTGLAFDMTVAGTSFKGTKQQIWLHEHCWEYGFIIRYQEDKEKITGFIAEAWHIRYVGKNHSLLMHEQNLCLEEYVERLLK